MAARLPATLFSKRRLSSENGLASTIPPVNVQQIPRVFQFASANQSPFCNKIRQIARGGCRRSASNRAVLSGAHTAFEALRPFGKHPQQRLLLPIVNLAA